MEALSRKCVSHTLQPAHRSISRATWCFVTWHVRGWIRVLKTMGGSSDYILPTRIMYLHQESSRSHGESSEETYIQVHTHPHHTHGRTRAHTHMYMCVHTYAHTHSTLLEGEVPAWRDYWSLIVLSNWGWCPESSSPLEKGDWKAMWPWTVMPLSGPHCPHCWIRSGGTHP